MALALRPSRREQARLISDITVIAKREPIAASIDAYAAFDAHDVGRIRTALDSQAEAVAR